MRDPRSIILEKQVTEKGTALAEKHNQHLFRVARWANKVEIRRAVEKIFNVSVSHVNVQNYRGKTRRDRTQKYGRRSDWRRAIVTLKEGSKIEAV